MVNFENISIDGISASVPESSQETENCPLLSDKEKKIISSRFGVNRVHKSKHQTTYTLCLNAANKLINGLKWEPSEIDLIISVTQTPDFLIPSNASFYQKALDLRPDCIAFEVNSGCTGYLQSLMIAASFIQNKSIKRAIVLAGETTHIVSETDKASLPFMGDAGTATALSYKTGNPALIFNNHMNGTSASAIHIPAGGASYAKTSIDSDLPKEKLKVVMNGETVKDYIFYEALPELKSFIQQCEENQCVTDYYIFHQVNKLILDGLANKLSISSDAVLTCLEEYGNTSSASIPLCICHHHEKINQKSIGLILSGFGVGMANINARMELDNALISKVALI